MIFLLLGLQAGGAGWPPPWWLVVGAVMVVATVFVEPFFTRPQDAIANAVAGLGAYASADRQEVDALWTGLLGLMVVLLIAGVASAVAISEGRLKWIANRISMTLGRAVLVGGFALSLEVVGRAARGDQHFQFLGLGTAVLLLAVGVDWGRVLNVIRRGRVSLPSSIASVIGPSALLIEHGQQLTEGKAVQLSRTNSEGTASVVGSRESWLTPKA